MGWGVFLYEGVRVSKVDGKLGKWMGFNEKLVGVMKKSLKCVGGVLVELKVKWLVVVVCKVVILNMKNGGGLGVL